MQFIQGNNRHQTYFSTPDDQVSADNAVRLMDAFIDKLDLQKLGFTNTIHKGEGRPPYAPGVLLKLYLYGYLNKIRSSRKLEKECSRNIELQWLLQNLQPNYHTIADFRKLHASHLQAIFRLYVQFLSDAGLLGKSTIGIDGSKFKAVNSKKNNFNQNKIDKHQQFIKDKAERYLQELDEMDNDENKTGSDELQIKKEKIAEGLAKLKGRTIKYDCLQQQLNDTTDKQISITDTDSRSILKDLDSWVRNRLRYCIWTDWKKPERKRKNLIRLGVDHNHAYAWSRTRKGGWAVAQSPIMITTITLERLRKRGYEAMLDYYSKYLHNLMNRCIRDPLG